MTSHRDHEWAEGPAAAVVLGLLAGIVFLIQLIVTVSVRAYLRHPGNPLLLAAAAAWVVALLAAAAIYQAAHETGIAVTVSVMATVIWVTVAGLVSTVLDERQASRPGDDGDLTTLFQERWWAE